MKQKVEIKTSVIINFDKERYEKERFASQLKQEGDINEACRVLYEISDQYCSIDTRLPLYLQQAGRFDESIIEMKKILQNSPKKHNEDFSYLSIDKRNYHLLSHYSHVFDKLRLIHQREKMNMHVIYFGIMSAAFKCYSMKAHIQENIDCYHTLSETLDRDTIKSLCKKAKLPNNELEDYLISNLLNQECSFSSIQVVNKIVSDKLAVDIWDVFII